MNVIYDDDFLKLLKKTNVKIRKSFRKAIKEFSKNPQSRYLNNHELTRDREGYRSININADWRAIYKEIEFADEKVAYFTEIGTHKDLYSSK